MWVQVTSAIPLMKRGAELIRDFVNEISLDLTHELPEGKDKNSTILNKASKMCSFFI